MFIDRQNLRESFSGNGAGCLMFALMKVKCNIDGCCAGRQIVFGDISFVFPSQITEAVVNLLLAIILYKIVKEKKPVGFVYPYFMILYGSTRFFLNMLRNTRPWMFGIPAGNIWSLVSVGIGLLAVVWIRNSNTVSHN